MVIASLNPQTARYCCGNTLKLSGLVYRRTTPSSNRTRKSEVYNETKQTSPRLPTLPPLVAITLSPKRILARLNRNSWPLNANPS